ncbi:ATP synthase F1 subunit delta [Gloeobacter kilaueensis]|uniref:ATP synthase subunit delta n=1 Tax=Gloeobacter kilaueensis (strain ATCC BAA-2537 / CCAP 1431/1 / ULC 316 / JS1) TaxID=1183438 RepID=U5QHY3_GLOK1|nr:ATP synthase F1 subunit delta [Gloeobacter kilaueensis]AGY58478.1 F0F1 ATP synthase subunit delta [Gloeobacter kilaueensis JS1]
MQKDSEQIALRYAEALKDLGLSEEGLLDEFGRTTEALLEVLDANPELERLLATPLVSLADKKRVLAQIFEGKVHPYVLNFLQLLVDRRRIGFLRPICNQFQILLRKLQQVTLAEVISAVPLSQEQQEALLARIQTRTSARRVELRTRINPELLGGMIIKIGDEIIDASLRGQLRKLTLQLTLS